MIVIMQLILLVEVGDAEGNQASAIWQLALLEKGAEIEDVELKQIFQ